MFCDRHGIEFAACSAFSDGMRYDGSTEIEKSFHTVISDRICNGRTVWSVLMDVIARNLRIEVRDAYSHVRPVELTC